MCIVLIYVFVILKLDAYTPISVRPTQDYVAVSSHIIIISDVESTPTANQKQRGSLFILGKPIANTTSIVTWFVIVAYNCL